MTKQEIRRISPDELDDFIAVLLKDDCIGFTKPAQSSFKIKTKREESIMFYPSSLKIMISAKGKNKIKEFETLDKALRFLRSY